MPGVPPVSQESWKHVQQSLDIMQAAGGRPRRKKRHKLSIAKLCSCVVAEPAEDFPESSRPFEKKSPDSTGGESVVTGDQTIAPQVAVVNQKSPLDATSEEEEPAQDIEMPPPMEIQEHSFKPDNKEVSTDDVTTKLASQLTLKSQPEAASSMDLANQIESIVKQRIEPSGDASSTSAAKADLTSMSAEESQVSLEERQSNKDDGQIEKDEKDGMKEDEDDDDKGETGGDKESEKAKYLKKRQ
ncbi:ATPase family AAA domain-containing protein 2 [Aplysia californica]|uniref:ATPase family AAA domain-containing protein 2 n=1 Tax=Aplysia californica TaxID=6500 RepID=A0ABM1A6J6_APLCA|nr:ATPase family AAA domain-containing protein 2 [Aplysia californica]